MDNAQVRRDFYNKIRTKNVADGSLEKYFQEYLLNNPGDMNFESIEHLLMMVMRCIVILDERVTALEASKLAPTPRPCLPTR
jgi:hypothetical protein